MLSRRAASIIIWLDSSPLRTHQAIGEPFPFRHEAVALLRLMQAAARQVRGQAGAEHLQSLQEARNSMCPQSEVQFQASVSY